jgi:hypothetical protein
MQLGFNVALIDIMPCRVWSPQSCILLSCTCLPTVLGHGSATVPQQRPGTAAAGFGRNMFAPGSISPGALQPAMPLQQRPNTSGGGMFGSGSGNRMGAGGGVGGGGSMRLMPRGGSLGLGKVTVLLLVIGHSQTA